MGSGVGLLARSERLVVVGDEFYRRNFMCLNILILCDLIIYDCVEFKYYHIVLHFKFFKSKKLFINVRSILVKIGPEFKWGQSICWPPSNF